MGTTMQKAALLKARFEGHWRASIGLRPATANDDDFLYRVYESAREEEFRHIDWEANQKAALLAMQISGPGCGLSPGLPGLWI